MVNILIKSFFRPYLLDRCLYSIYNFVEGEYTIEILDDGTPSKYLDKIKSKYPEVKISLSLNHASKVKMIEEHINNTKKYNNKIIPTDFWLEKILSSHSSNIILTEDDVWFIKKINISNLAEKMDNEKIDLIQLGYQNDHFNFTRSYQKDEKLNYYKPKLLLKSPKFYGIILNNSYGITNLLQKIRIIPKSWKRQLWILYNIPMGIYNKEYLAFIWKDAYHRVLENLQLKNALTWYLKNLKKGKKYAAIKNQVMTTSFISSASFNNHLDFDLIKYNDFINQLWINDSFDILENFPSDFTDLYIKKTLEEHSNNINYNEWKNWKNKFMNSFESSNNE